VKVQKTFLLVILLCMPALSAHADCEPPNLSYPPDESQLQEMTDIFLVWYASPCADYYRIQLSQFPDMSFPSTTETDQTNAWYGSLDIGTRYYWRVKSREGGQWGSQWSDVWYFDVIPDVLDIEEVFQPDNSNWCWAACSRAILMFYGDNEEQCDIADYARNANGWGTGSCCDIPIPSVCDQQNDLYGDNGSVDAILANFGGLRSYGQNSSLTIDEIEQQITEEHPFIFRVLWEDQSDPECSPDCGHQMVVRGIDGTMIYYMDPREGYGYEFVQYNWFVDNPEWEWTHTLTISDISLSFVVNPDPISIPENGTQSLSVRLNSNPLNMLSTSVSVSGDPNIYVQTGGTLVFSAEDWDEFKPVVLVASDDPDVEDGTATILIQGTSGPLIPDKNVSATEDDDDELMFEVSASSVVVPEEDVAQLEVWLSAQPPGDVGVSVTRLSGDSDITVQSGSALTFNTTNWADHQAVTLAAAEDPDMENGTATILIQRISGPSVPDRNVTATEEDNDGLLFDVSTSAVEVPEGNTEQFELWLTAEPPTDVGVSVSRSSGDEDITVESGSALIFTTTNWADHQAVTLAAAEDSDMENGTATILIQGISGPSVPDTSVTATEDDNDGGLFEAVMEDSIGDTGNGQGVSWADYDNDGDQDLYLAKSSGGNRLFQNNAGLLTDVTTGPEGDTGSCKSGVWGDYDNDGDVDLYLANNGANKLLRNQGGGVFVDVTSETGTGHSGNAFGAAWADYDNNGYLDLYVANENSNVLYWNDGNGLFVNVTNDAGVGGGNVKSRGVAWGDYDDDGNLDLYVSNLDLANKLYRNNADGTFSDESPSPINHSGPGQSEGAVWLDYDNDGDLDLYIAVWGDENRLYSNDGGGSFSTVPGDHEDTGNGHGVACGDYDNDGDLDLYVTNYGNPNKLFRNDSGVYVDVTDAVVGDTNNGSGVAWCDFDGDGDLDLYVANTNAANKLYQNDQTTGNHWLHVELRSNASNGSAIGARVRLVTGGTSQVRDVSGGSGYCSQNSLPATFGLGGSTMIDTLAIIWPSGIHQAYAPFTPLDRQMTFVEWKDTTVTSIGDHPEASNRLVLYPCSPNPFNPMTTIRYELAEASPVSLRVYDVAGRLVRTLISSDQENAGLHVVLWNGYNDRGQQVASGVYYCHVIAGRQRATQRMVLLK
jgi:hypothetical protein